MKWPWILGVCVVVPVLFYVLGYFWTRGSMIAKKEYLDGEFTSKPESKSTRKIKGE